MSLSNDTKDLILSALGTPEATNELIAEIELQGAGDIKADGSVPFSGNINLGGFKGTSAANPTSAQDLATKNYVDTQSTNANYIKKDGSTAFTGDQSLGSHKLTNVTDPSSAQDAATKNYVDTHGSNILVFTSNPGPSGVAGSPIFDVSFVVTGLLSTDTILSVTQKNPGAAGTLALLGWHSQANNALVGEYVADPGVGAIIVVAVKR